MGQEAVLRMAFGTHTCIWQGSTLLRNGCAARQGQRKSTGESASRLPSLLPPAGTFMFFALLLLLTLGVTSKSSKRLPLHTGFWPLKILLWYASGCLLGLWREPGGRLLGGVGELRLQCTGSSTSRGGPLVHSPAATHPALLSNLRAGAA